MSYWDLNSPERKAAWAKQDAQAAKQREEASARITAAYARQVDRDTLIRSTFPGADPADFDLHPEERIVVVCGCAECSR